MIVSIIHFVTCSSHSIVLPIGHRLDAPVLKRLYALSGPECVLHCLNHKCCRSVNYDEQYLPFENITNCELLHEIATERPEKLKSDVNFSHLALLQPNRVRELVV